MNVAFALGAVGGLVSQLLTAKKTPTGSLGLFSSIGILLVVLGNRFPLSFSRVNASNETARFSPL